MKTFSQYISEEVSNAASQPSQGTSLVNKPLFVWLKDDEKVYKLTVTAESGDGRKNLKQVTVKTPNKLNIKSVVLTKEFDDSGVGSVMTIEDGDNGGYGQGYAALDEETAKKAVTSPVSEKIDALMKKITAAEQELLKLNNERAELEKKLAVEIAESHASQV